MWVWSGLINRWRALGGLSPIANKGNKQLVPAEMAGESCSGVEAGRRACPAGMSLAPCTVRVTEAPRGAVQLLTLHLPAAWWACRVKEVPPPNMPGVSQHLHPLWSGSYFSMPRKSCTQHGICRVTAVGSSLSPGNYFIISLSAQSCKLITFIADFVYTSVY